MPTEVTEIGPCTRRISVTIPPAQIQDALRDTWKEAQRNIQIKGFRPGKVPRHILEKRYGQAVQDEVKQSLINDAYREAIQSHRLSPVRHPRIDPSTLTLEPEKSFDFEVTIEVRPEFELAEFRGIEVGAPVVQVRPENIDREIDGLRSRAATFQPIEEGVAAKGDYITADVSYQIDGAIVLHHEDAVVDTNRDQVDGLNTEGGTAAFAGKGIGATVSVPVHLPPDFEPRGFAGAEAQLLCTVKRIRRVMLPELNEEFARTVGAESVDDLRAKVTAQYTRHVENDRNRYIEERVFDELIRRNEFEVPPELLNHATHERIHQLQHELKDAGLGDAEAKANVASHTDRIRQDEARQIRVMFLVEKIAEREKLFVTESEIESSIRSLAAMNGADPQAVYDELDDSGRLPGLRAQLLENKVRKRIRESAKVTDATPEPKSS